MYNDIVTVLLCIGIGISLIGIAALLYEAERRGTADLCLITLGLSFLLVVMLTAALTLAGALG